MKLTQKTALLPILILFLAAVFAYAQDANRPQLPPPPPPEPQAAPPPEPPDRPEFTFDESFTNKLIEDLKQTDPNEAQKLEKLRQENPRLFQIEIRKLVWRQHRMPGEGLEPNRAHRRAAMQGPEGDAMALRGKERGRERLRERETEFLSWLSKNDPNDAKELTALSEKDPPAYVRKLAVEMKKYREIIDAEQINPAVAELLKKDLGLKQKRNGLLEKLKGATDKKQKEELTAQLKEVISERFDVILQKKQLQYEDLKKKLEELQKDVNKSQADLENDKNNKEELIKKHLDDLINKAGQFDWD